MVYVTCSNDIYHTDWRESQGMQNPYHWKPWEEWALTTRSFCCPWLLGFHPWQSSSVLMVLAVGEEWWSGPEALWRLWRPRRSDCFLPYRSLLEPMLMRLWELQCQLLGSQWKKQRQRRQPSLLQKQTAWRGPKSMLKALRLKAVKVLHQQKLKQLPLR